MVRPQDHGVVAHRRRPGDSHLQFLRCHLHQSLHQLRAHRDVHQHPTGKRPGLQDLQQPTKEEAQAISTYSSSKFVPGNTNGEIAFPFIDINNRVLISSASYDPGILAGLTWSEIAGGLNDPTNPATQAIVGTANYISAAVCAASSNAPSSVCDSPGVRTAAKALKLT